MGLFDWVLQAFKLEPNQECCTTYSSAVLLEELYPPSLYALRVASRPGVAAIDRTGECGLAPQILEMERVRLASDDREILYDYTPRSGGKIMFEPAEVIDAAGNRQANGVDYLRPLHVLAGYRSSIKRGQNRFHYRPRGRRKRDADASCPRRAAAL